MIYFKGFLLLLIFTTLLEHDRASVFLRFRRFLLWIVVLNAYILIIRESVQGEAENARDILAWSSKIARVAGSMRIAIMMVDLDIDIIRDSIGLSIHKLFDDYESGKLQDIWQDAEMVFKMAYSYQVLTDNQVA